MKIQVSFRSHRYSIEGQEAEEAVDSLSKFFNIDRVETIYRLKRKQGIWTKHGTYRIRSEKHKWT